MRILVYSLARLRGAIKFVVSDAKKVRVDAGDLRELLYHFDRLDDEVRCENKRDNLTILETNLATIIDDIDTVSDIAKGDNIVYRRMVESHVKRLYEYVHSDGYKFSKKAKA